MTHRLYWTYILTNGRNTVFYVGMTNDLERRVDEHRDGAPGSSTERYRVWKLVYAEPYRTAREAIEREKRLKRWRRTWKEELIARVNPQFQSLEMEDVGEMVARLEDAWASDGPRRSPGRTPG